MKRYRLDYFYDRKNYGSINVDTELKASNYYEEDDFLNALVEEGKISNDLAFHTIRIIFKEEL